MRYVYTYTHIYMHSSFAVDILQTSERQIDTKPVHNIVGYGKCPLCVLENKTIGTVKRRIMAQAREQGTLWGGNELQPDLEVLLGVGRKWSNLERYPGFSFFLSSVPDKGLKNCLLNQRIGLWSFCIFGCEGEGRDRERRGVR